MIKETTPKNSQLFHFKAQESVGLIPFLTSQVESLPYEKAWELVEFGAIYVNKLREQDPGRELVAEDIVRAHLDPRRYAFDPAILEGRIVEINDHYAVINKPAGIPMHKTVDNARENLLALLVAHSGGEAFVTHRLDIPTEGLVVVARTQEFQSRFNKMIMKKALEKKYRALTLLEPRVGFYQHWMKPELRAPRTVVGGPAVEGWDECRLNVESVRAVELASGSTAFESVIKLETGRTHQIRCQLSAEGFPILGDPEYGGADWDKFGLQAFELSFRCPMRREPVSWTLETRPWSI